MQSSNKRVESGSLRRRFALPSLANHANRNAFISIELSNGSN
jgi:hypothetical protein